MQIPDPGVLGLPAPSFREAQGDLLNPNLVTSGATAQVPYDAVMTPGSIVTLFAYGLVDGAVVGDEYSTLVDDATTFPIAFTVPYALIVQLIDYDVHIGYEISGADTSSDERIYRVAVPATLEAPQVREAAGAWLDPADVNDTTGAHVRVDWTGMNVGDNVALTWDGSATGAWASNFKIRVVGPQLRTVNKAALVTPNTGGTVMVSYVVNGSAPSDVLTLNVGSESVELPPPTIDGASDGYLDPATITFGAVARLPATLELLPGDVVTLHFADSEAQGTPPEFLIDALAVARVLGTTVPVFYTLQRDGVTSTSATLPLRVGTFDQEDPDLPAPVLDEAVSGVLDLATFEGDAQVSVDAWPLAIAGQVVWLELHGTAAGSARIITLLDTHTLTAQEAAYGLGRPVDRSALEALDDGSALTVKLWVGFAGSPYKQDAVLFPTSGYRLVKAPAAVPAITRVRDSQGDIPNGGWTASTTLVLMGTAEPGREVEILDEAVVMGTAQVDPYGNWTLQLSGLSVKTHRFTARGRYGSSPVSAEWVIHMKKALEITGFRDYYGTFYPPGSTAGPNGPDPSGSHPGTVLSVYPDGVGATPNQVEVWIRYARIDGVGVELHKPLTGVSPDGSFQAGSARDRTHFILDTGVINGTSVNLWLVDTDSGETSDYFRFTFRFNV